MTRFTGLSDVTVTDQLELYRRMWVLRLLDMALEEARIDGLLNQAVQPVFGQEAVAVGVTAALRPGDVVATTIPHFRHARRIGEPLGLALTVVRLYALGKIEDEPVDEMPVGNWRQSLSAAGTLGQSILFALGDAHQQQLAGDGEVTLCVIEQREANRPEFTAAASIAVSWRLPVVFVVENVRPASGARQNGYVARRKGMPALSADGKDVAAVRDAVAGAVGRASAGGGPTLVSAVTYRTDHPAGVDPLVFESRRLTAAGVDAGRLYEVERRARRLMAEAEQVAKVTRGAWGPPPAKESTR